MAVLLSLLAIPSLGAGTASAQSRTGGVEAWTDRCVTRDNHTSEGDCDSYMWQTLNQTGTTDTQGIWGRTNAAIATVQDADNINTSDPEALVWPIVGEIMAQAEELTGLQSRLEIDASTTRPYAELYATNSTVPFTVDQRAGVVVRPECLTTPTTCPVLEPSGIEIGAAGNTSNWGGVDTSNFEPFADWRRYWYPKETDNKADGIVIYLVLKATEKPNPAWDYFATSQHATVRPLNNRKATRLETWMLPLNESIQVVQAAPLSTNPYGNSGSMTVGATLSGEAKMRERYSWGAAFSISRTWVYNAGVAGGGMLSDQKHIAEWHAGDTGGSRYQREASGVATWKVPSKRPIGFNTSAVVFTKK